MAESEEELKSLLMTVKEESEKAVLKLNSHGIHSHHFMANRWGNNENSERLYFLGAPKSLQMVTAAMKLKDACSLEGKFLISWQQSLSAVTLEPKKIKVCHCFHFSPIYLP